MGYNITPKRVILVFKSGKQQPINVPPVFLNGIALEQVKSVKYLGHIVVSDLTDDDDT